MLSVIALATNFSMLIVCSFKRNPSISNSTHQSARVEVTGVLSQSNIIKIVLKIAGEAIAPFARKMMLLCLHEAIDRVLEGYTMHTDFVNCRTELKLLF